MYNYPNYNYYPYANNYNTQQLPQQQTSTLNGKIVESKDVVRSIEIPFGSFGVYVQGDQSAIYLKQWMNDGTTKIDEYQKVVIDENNNSENTTLDDIMSSISSLSKKIDKIQSRASSKKEVNNDDK